MGGTAESVGLGFGALVLLSVYLLSNLLIGFFAHRSGETWTARDYFLGGKMTGTVVLFFVMLATKFSGNTFFGLPGQAYRVGLMSVMLIPFIIAITLGLLSYAPRLYVLSKKYDYLTPADFFADRFQSRSLRLVVACFLILTMIPYLMIQMTGMGHAFVGFTNGQYSFTTGVVYISTVMLGYVLLSGWRGVVWAEVLQGSLLLGSIIVAAAVLVSAQGGIASVIRLAVQIAPEKVAVTDSYTALTRSYFLYALVFGLGGSMYPQIIQSVYAAKTERALRRSMAMMVPNYFLIMLCVVLIGLVGIVRLQGLETRQADQILGHLLGQQITHLYWVVLLVFVGAAAAIMSTAAGVLLTLSSMLTHDVYRHFFRPHASEDEIAKAGRIFTVFILLVVMALSLRPITTLWQLTIIKFEFLMQLYLPLILGLYWPRFSCRAAFVGILLGMLGVVSMLLSGWQHIWIFEAGLVGVALNACGCIGVTLLIPPNAAEQERVHERFFGLFDRARSLRTLDQRIQVTIRF